MPTTKSATRSSATDTRSAKPTTVRTALAAAGYTVAPKHAAIEARRRVRS